MYGLSELYRYVIEGVDGDVGRIEDAYFDDRAWIVRHLVVDNRHRRDAGRVLIPPAAVRAIDDPRRRVAVGLTRAQVEHSPSIDTAKPVSRQHHIDVCSYFGFPYDWTGSAVRQDPLAGLGGGDPHLRSARAVAGYVVRTIHDEWGQIDDVLIEVSSWAIRYVVVRPRRHGAPTLVSPARISGVSWEGRVVEVDMECEAAHVAPPRLA
jgi:sporulation protein YlmC with PRC-barrel domain